MPLISQQEAADLLKVHIPFLHQIPLDAWDDYHRNIPARLLASFCPRTRASAIHNLMLTRAAKYAHTADGVSFFESHQMLGLLIGNAAIRLKKLDEDGRSKSQPTRQVQRFRNQERVTGIDALHHLELGYVTNDAATEVAEIRLACPSGDNVAWWMRLNGEGGQAVVMDMFTPPSGNDPSPAPAKIKPKQTKESGIILPFSKSD